MKTKSFSLSVMTLCVVACLTFLSAATRAQSAQEAGWPTYGNDPGGTRYSPAKQIDRGNVAQLKVAWTFRTGALDVKTRLIEKAAFEATPILVDGKLFLSTPYDHVIALNPETGAKIWEFDPKLELPYGASEVTPAIAITTKMGRVLVLNRLTGAPLLPVEERPAMKSDIPGEEAWPTQPASTISLVPEKLSANDAWGKDEQERQWCADKIKSARAGDIVIPPSLQ